MIEAVQVSKDFGHPPTRVLSGIDLKIENGDFVSIHGRSGSGKSTLLYILSTLDHPTQGEVSFDGQKVKEMSVRDLDHLRNTQIGFIFQFHYLLPELTALENILLPPRKTGQQEKFRGRALELISQFGLKGHEHKFPGQLSGGQQQRVAITRALIMNPKYLFADEPTGNLDYQNGLMVLEILKEVNATQGATVVLVTHERDFSSMAKREVLLKDGFVV
ncbi:MAG: ATP-binding protein [Bdellovibrionales bacterium GWA2_49_15]|nr:MAG: ATP-binding protein [Bdellovibrionales bacterium GWA2_49_15]